MSASNANVSNVDKMASELELAVKDDDALACLHQLSQKVTEAVLVNGCYQVTLNLLPAINGDDSNWARAFAIGSHTVTLFKSQPQLANNCQLEMHYTVNSHGQRGCYLVMSFLSSSP